MENKMEQGTEQPTQENEDEIQGQEIETEVESRKVSFREIAEKVIGELTKELENDIESLRKKVEGREDFERGEETGEIKPSHLTDVRFRERLLLSAETELGRKMAEIEEEALAISSLGKEKRGQLKEFLEREKQESEVQSKELNELYEIKLQVIKAIEENKETKSFSDVREEVEEKRLTRRKAEKRGF